MEIRHNEEGWWIGPYPDYLDAELDIEALHVFIGRSQERIHWGLTVQERKRKVRL